MKERRRDPRIPVVLDTMVKKDGWRQHLSADVSRRGIFVLRSDAIPVTQLLQIRVRLPGEDKLVEMMAKVSRTVLMTPALSGDGLPGVGLEFFCLSGEALNRWDRFILKARKLHERHPGANGYALFQMLKNEGDDMEQTTTVPVDEGRANLIFRAHTMDRLWRFLNEDLHKGQLNIRIPYRLGQNSRVNLRVIHPDTYEEFSLPGTISTDKSSQGILVQFEDLGRNLVTMFEEFVVTGGVPARQEVSAC